ncbi:high mobility group protein DSP1 isoform X1 [Cotesia glomerata]|uniref:high mobility group protein DSP1 isoform X1 n=1 Tax=Cotesia glomerata TaxID=32391 RepID=UPI001D0046D0|nr:high mobility group protein DSP1 isoform X1 [Cotesia glomerata]
MSEHHRVAAGAAGGWGTSSPGNREDNGGTGNAGGGANNWWPGINAEQQQQLQQQAAAVVQQQTLHQHLMNQQAAAAAAQQLNQHHQDIVRSTAAGTQHLFSYKTMAASFQNPATGGQSNSTVSTTSSNSGGASGNPNNSSGGANCMRGGYDYRMTGQTGGAGSNTSAGGANTNNSNNQGNTPTGNTNTQTNPPAGSVQWWYSSGAVMDANNVHQQMQGQHISSNQIPAHQIQQLPGQNNLQQNNAQITKMPRGKTDSKPRGRMTAYAFFVQTCRQEHKKKHPEETIVFQEFSKKCADRWKIMSDKEKKRFQEMAEKDKKRYDAEMQNYTPPKGENIKGRGKKRKHLKDPNAPKRSLSAFFWFCHDERGNVKMRNPEYGVGDIAKELGKKWSDADPETKSKYEAMAEKDKARYEREMTAYKKKMKDGPDVMMGAPANAMIKHESEEDMEEDDAEDDDE